MLVVGFRRPDLIRQAIKSVLDQSISSSSVELIVVNDFESDWIDSACSARRGTHITRQGDQGTFLADAIGAARGDFLCFLDDDDLFDRHKLERVCEAVRCKPDMGYLHNGWRSFSSDGSIFPGEESNKSGPFRVRVAQKSAQSLARVIHSHNWVSSFNLSCVTLRREIAESVHALFKRLRGLPDGLALLASFRSPYSVVFSEEPLTYYRLHSRSYFRPTDVPFDHYISSRAEIAERYLACIPVLAEAVKGTEYAPLVSGHRVYWELIRSVFRNSPRLSPHESLPLLQYAQPLDHAFVALSLLLANSLGLQRQYQRLSYIAQTGRKLLP